MREALLLTPILSGLGNYAYVGSHAWVGADHHNTQVFDLQASQPSSVFTIASHSIGQIDCEGTPSVAILLSASNLLLHLEEGICPPKGHCTGLKMNGKTGRHEDRKKDEEWKGAVFPARRRDALNRCCMLVFSTSLTRPGYMNPLESKLQTPACSGPWGCGTGLKGLGERRRSRKHYLEGGQHRIGQLMSHVEYHNRVEVVRMQIKLKTGLYIGV